MPTRELNFTGRKRITRRHVSIILHDESSPLAFEIEQLALHQLGLPASALVRLEVYRQSLYVPFELGNVGEITLPGRPYLREFDSPDGILFRVKVTSVDEATEGQLLAELDRIRPVRSSGQPESLLHVKPSDELGDEVFKLSWEPRPYLLVNARIELWRDIAVDPKFVSLVYPAALRTILTGILRGGEQADEESDEDWPAQWLRFAESLPSVGSHPTGGFDDYDDTIGDWVDKAVSVFCQEKRIYNEFVRTWNN